MCIEGRTLHHTGSNQCCLARNQHRAGHLNKQIQLIELGRITHQYCISSNSGLTSWQVQRIDRCTPRLHHHFAQLNSLHFCVAAKFVWLANYLETTVWDWIFQPMILGKDIIMAAWFFWAELSLSNNLNLAINCEVTFLTSMLTPGITAAYGIN